MKDATMSDLNEAIKLMITYAVDHKIQAAELTSYMCPNKPGPWEEAAATILNAVVSGNLTPAPQMPEDVAKLPDQCEPTGDWRKVIAGLNASDPQDMMVIKPLIEAQAAENADLRAKLEEVEAKRDQWRNDCLDANQSELALRKRAEKAEAAGTFAQGIEAVRRFLNEIGEEGGDRFSWSDLDWLSNQLGALTPPVDVHPDDLAVDRFALAMKSKLAKKRAEGRGGWDRKDECSQQYLSILLRGHVCKGDPVDVANLAMMLHQRGEVITPTVDVRETPIRCHQAGLTTADERQGPQALKVKPLPFDWQKKACENPTAMEIKTDDYSAYILIPFDPGCDPHNEIGTWNGVANHKGQTGFATKEAAMRYCEDTIMADAERAVEGARRWITPQADPVREAAKVLQARLDHLNHLCATAERRGPSHEGYVTDATYHHWCGERSALSEALRALAGEQT